jgi:purine-binding chemotaxis protein CheW
MTKQLRIPADRQINAQVVTSGTETALIMRLSGEAFGIAVGLVHEIMDPIPVTKVPNAPAFASGLINVRGAVVPVVDVRERLRMAPTLPGSAARIVVLDVEIDAKLTRLAILADAVEEVIDIETSYTEPVPDMGAPWPEAYVRGVARNRGSIVVLLNPETLFRPDGGRSSNSESRT